MGIKRWRKVFSEVNCLENLSDQKPEDWKSDEACTLCKTTTDAQSPFEANNPQTTPHLLNDDPTDRASPSGQAASSEATAAAFSNFTSGLPSLASPSQFGDYLDANNNNSSFASLLKLTSMTTTPMMTSSLADSELTPNSLNSLNSLNNLISTTESMAAANQNGSNANLPKVVSILFLNSIFVAF